MHLHLPEGEDLHLAARIPDLVVIDAEVDEVAPAVADIKPAFLDPLAPAVEIEPAIIQLDVDPAQSHALAVDAGEIGLAADPRAEAAVERVIPVVELPGAGVSTVDMKSTAS